MRRLLRWMVLPAMLAWAAAAATALAETDAAHGERVKQMLEALPGGIKVHSLKPASMDGVYLAGTSDGLFYVYAQGRRVLIGNIFDLDRGGSGELETARAREAAARLRAVPLEQMIVFGPADAQRYVTVFTDIDCGYCRQLHSEMEVLNRGGLQVRYLMFPRTGINSPSYDKAVSVWCADDQQDAMTRAKAGQTITSRVCPNPIAEQFHLGEALGVRGTPTMYMDDGTEIGGYVPANDLLRHAGLSSR